MEAIVKTKSNFRNLNGKSLQVIEIVGTRVSCKTFAEDLGKEITVDFHKDNEVLAITMGLESSIVMKNDKLIPRKPRMPKFWTTEANNAYDTRWYRWMKKMEELGFSHHHICIEF